MTIKDLIKLYEKKKEKYSSDVFEYISELLQEAKRLHKKDWFKSPVLWVTTYF